MRAALGDEPSTSPDWCSKGSCWKPSLQLRLLAFSPILGFAKICPGGEDGKETLYFIALCSRSPWAERPTSPGSAPAEDRSQCLKKNSGGTGPRGQLERWILARGETGAPAVVLTHAGLRVLLPPRPGASWPDQGASSPPPPPPGSGGVAWRGGGFKSPRVSDRSDRSPNSSPPPGARSALQSARVARGASLDPVASQSTSPRLRASLLVQTLHPPHPPIFCS